MFHLLKVLIINALCYENETWNKKRLKVNIMYARVRSASSPVVDASSPGGDASAPIYTRGIIPFMFFNIKHKKNRPNYLFLQSRERTFALLLVPREKKFEKSFIL